MGRLFGKVKTGEIAINELACGSGRLGVRTCYNHYFLGIKTGSSCSDACFGGIINQGDGTPGTAMIDLSGGKFAIEAKRFKLEKDDKSGWWRWTCKTSGTSGIESTKKGARKAAREACGSTFTLEQIIPTAIAFEIGEMVEIAD